MNKHVFLILLIVAIIYSGLGYADNSQPCFPLHMGKVVFCNPDQAKAILKTKDGFINELSPFDRASRSNSDQDISVDSFLDLIAAQAQPWKLDELERVRESFKSIQFKSQKLKGLTFPEKIMLVKTTGREEGEAAYCRGNAIVLPQVMLEKSPAELENILIHELFHIYSKNHPEKRNELYRLIGFVKCPRLEFPKELTFLKITNPDAYENNYFIHLVYQNHEIKTIPILFAKKSYNPSLGLAFFDYLQFGLVQVEINGNTCKPMYRNGKLLIVPANKSYYEQIGENTDYIIHPEEVLADNFVLLMNGETKVKSDFVVEGMRRIINR